MLRSTKTMRGYTIDAIDGAIGTVDDLLFDDAQWTIRYLVVNTGGWLTGRLVLISPIAFREVHWEAKRFDIALTRQQIEESPSIAEDQPVSRQMEEEYFRYYGYPFYWSGLGLWAAGMYPSPLPPTTSVRPGYRDTAGQQQSTSNRAGDPHLRSTRQVTGYAIHARDGEIGHVDDFIVDDATWAIRYVVVATRNWWPGKKVLVSPRWLTSIHWGEARVAVDLSREAIKEAPEYEPSTLLNRAFETELHNRLQRTPYWDEENDT